MRSPVGTLLNKTPIPYVGRYTPRLPYLGTGGRQAQMEAMGKVGTLFAIVSRTSTGTAGVDWTLWRKAASGKKDDRTEVTRHAALDLWNNPNPYMTRQEFVEVSQQHLDLTGEAWWVIGRDPRSTLPLELWPVRPDRMEPVPSADDFLSGYIYTGPDSQKVPLGREDVIFLRMPNPMDAYRGMGPVQAIFVDLEAEHEAAIWNRNFFRNSAEPGGIVQVDRRLTDDEFDEARDRWQEQHQGVAAAHRVAILEGGMQWVERKYTQRDMQFAELRGVSSEKVREAFGFPKPMLGSTEDVNRANAEAAEVVFARWLIKPRLERFKGALCKDLLKLYKADTKLEFDYESPVEEDSTTENSTRDSKTASAVALVQAGWDPDEVLEALELPALTYKGFAVPGDGVSGDADSDGQAGEHDIGGPPPPGERVPLPRGRLTAALASLSAAQFAALEQDVFTTEGSR